MVCVMALLDDLRAAKTGSRELSDRVLLARGWTLRPVESETQGLLPNVWHSPDGQRGDELPSPTESVDDALAGVPVGWRYGLGWDEELGLSAYAYLTAPGKLCGEVDGEGWAKTIPLAICIATQETRESQEYDNDK